MIKTKYIPVIILFLLIIINILRFERWNDNSSYKTHEGLPVNSNKQSTTAYNYIILYYSAFWCDSLAKNYSTI